MDCAAHRVEKDGIPVELTAKEYSILELLLRNPRRVYTKAQLYAAVWGEAYLGDENAVNVHISRLRPKWKTTQKAPLHLHGLGHGYKLGGMAMGGNGVLLLLAAVLGFAALHFALRQRRLRRQLSQAAQQLAVILDGGSDEALLVPLRRRLTPLLGQIDRLLLEKKNCVCSSGAVWRSGVCLPTWPMTCARR